MDNSTAPELVTGSMEKDKEVFSLIKKELKRQRNGIELIASENFASAAVVAAAANVFTNKYFRE